MKQRFYSKKDWGVGVFFFALTVLSLIICSSVFYAKTTPPAPVAVKMGVFMLTFGAAVFIVSLWFNTWFEIENEFLICRSGPIVKKISISTIRTLSKPRKIIFRQSYLSLGMSFTQTIISYNKYDDVSISPADFDGLVNALKLRNPGIVVVN